jgi:hypothetical protein
MLIDQPTPHLPKDNEEVNVHVKHLQAMPDAATVVDPVLDRDGEVRGHELDHRRVRMGIQPAVSLHQRSVTEGIIGMIEICAMSSVAEMHATRLTTDARSMSASSKSDVMRGSMNIMAPYMTDLTDSAPLKEGATREESKPFPTI